MPVFKHRLLRSSAIFATMLASSTAFADDTGKKDDTQNQVLLAPISVTAQKREEDVQDVPISIDVRSEDDLNAKQIHSTTDLLQSSPNAQFGGGVSGAAYTPYTAVRGVGSAEVDSDPSIGMFVDGIPLTDTQSYTSGLLDMQQVEILRGPQGTLYGRNTLGGSVNMTTNKPDTDALSGKVQIDAGTKGVRTEVVGNAPITKGKSAARLAVSVDHAPNDTENDTGKDTGGHERAQGRFSLLTAPGDSTTMTTSIEAQTQKLRDQGVKTLADYQADRDSISVGNPFHGTSQSLLARNEIVHELGSGATLTSLTGARYQKTEFNGSSAPDGYFATTEALMQGFGVTGYTHRTSNPYESEFTQLSQEFRYTSPEQQAFRYVVGLYGDLTSTERTYGAGNSWDSNLVLTGTGVDLRMKSTTDSRSLAAFGDASYDLTEALEAFAGLRVGYDSKDFEYRMSHNNASYMALMFTGATSLMESYEGSLDKVYTTPRAGLRYKFNDDNSVYGSVSQGYKSGGFNASMLFSNGSTPAEYKSERLTNYEIGMKNSLFGGNVSLSSALFYIDWKDQQVLSYDATTTATPIVNADKSRSYGGEVSGRAELGAGWHVGAGLGYSDATYEDFKNAPRTGGGGSFDASGNQQQYHSKFTGNAELGYSWDPNLLDMTASATVGYQYRSKFYFDAQNTMAQDGYGTVNARIGAENEHYGLYLWGQNLTDEKYLVSSVNYGSGVLVSEGDGVSFGLSGSLKF